MTEGPNPTEAAAILARLRATLRVSTPIKPMPKVRPMTQAHVDRMKAFQMVTQEIAAAAERCEALEQEIA